MPLLKFNFRPGRLKERIRGNLLEPYFCFWSRLYLRRWRPSIVLVTGTVGKTSLLYLLKEQFADKACFSEKANTKTGITLHMLGLPNTVDRPWRWLLLIFLVPWRSLTRPVRPEKVYLVEYDIYDMYSARYFKWWLRPDICLWLSLTPVHLEFFDRPAARRKMTALQLMTRELLKIVKSAQQRIFAPADDSDMRQALAGPDAPVTWVETDLLDYKVDLKETLFKFKEEEFVFSQPLPPAMAASLALLKAAATEYRLALKTDWRSWRPPLSRNQVLAGYKGCHLLDSTYNAQLAAMMAVFEMFKKMPVPTKWLVCGDMLEQGSWMAEAHAQLARAIVDLKPDRLFLIGRRIKKHTVPVLEKNKIKFDWREKADGEFGGHLKNQIQGGEVILFKGAGYLGIIVESLLANPDDKKLLNAAVRRKL